MSEYSFKVEKGVPKPKGNSTRVSYPFPEMEIGDSFFVDANASPTECVRTAASSYGKKHGLKFEVKNYYAPKGCRVWRTQ